MDYTASTCSDYIDMQWFSAYTLITALLILVLLSFLEKRKNPKRCMFFGERPGLITPGNLLDGNIHRWSYAAAFGSTASSCLTLLFSLDKPATDSVFSALVVLLYVLLVVTATGLNFFPLFACLTTGHKILGSIIGFLYTIVWVAFNACIVADSFNYPMNLFPSQWIVIQLPVFLCLFYLLFTFLKNFLVYSSWCPLSAKPKMTNSLCSPSQQRYVRMLINCKERDRIKKQSGFRSYLRRLFKPGGDPEFQYSDRIVCIFSVTCLCLYQYGLIVFFYVTEFLNVTLDSLRRTEEMVSANTPPGLVQILDSLVVASFVCWYIAIAIATAMMVIYVLQILMKYKKNLLKMYKGDHSRFRNVSTKAIGKTLGRSLMFPGSQVAYMIWGYSMLLFTLFFTGLFIVVSVILPLAGILPMVLFSTVLTALLGFLLAVLIRHGVVLLATFAFLQKPESGERILRLTNRRAYHVLSYFLFFYYIVLGIVSCFNRIIKNTLLGMIFLGRIDRCGLISGFETWDRGYMLYVSFLKVEETHTHPVMRMFCEILLKNRKLESSNDTASGFSNELYVIDANDYSVPPTIARRKWWKAYTLVKNPSLRSNSNSEAPTRKPSVHLDVKI